jgi:hypothetical protein
LVITAICSFEQEAFGQGTVNDVVRTQTIGSEVHILVDAAALDLFGDSVITSLNPDSDAKWNTWKDVLTNSNSPGMDVNFDGNNAYGIGNLLVSGLITADGDFNLGGSFAINSDKFTVAGASGNTLIGGTLGVTGLLTATTFTSGNATFSGTLDVAGAAEFSGKAKFDGNIGTNQSEAPAVYIGLSAANDPQIQLQGTSAADRPHIDFANAESQDADARLILMGDDDFQFAGTNVSIVGNYGLEVSGNAGVDGDFDVNTNKFTVAGSSGNTSVAGTLDVAGASTFADAVTVTGSVEMNDAVDLNADLDADGADFDFDATNYISLDAGAASNFTTSSGVLTLEGADGVTVTSTGGTLALNGTGQTIDLDATTLDVDATTITVDATTTTFTGDVKGPKATGDDEFVTYWQLDSLANTSPYHESVMIIKKGNTPQPIIEVNGNGHDPAVSFADNPSLMFEFESDASENGDFIDYPLGPDYLQVNQTGVYTVDVSMELATSSQGMFPVTLVVRNTDALDIASQQDVELAASTVWVSPNAAPSYWVSTTMTVIMDNVNEKLHMDLLPYGGSADVISYKFVVSRIGAE